MISLDAEKAVVCSILVEPKMLDDISEVLDSSDFTDISYGLIYGTLKEMHVGDIDIISLSEALGKKGVLNQIGGMTFLSDIYHSMSTSSNVLAYAKVVKEGSRFRSLTAKLKNALITINDALSYDDAVSEVNAILSAIEVSTNGYEPFKDILKSQMMALDARHKNGGGFEGISTGFGNLDDLTQGLNGGDYFILGARPSMGKELTMNSLVLLSNGKFKPMRDMTMNDSVASVDGKKSKVIGVYPQGEKPVYKITFSDGRSVDAGLEHQWEVMFRAWEKPRVMTTKQLIEKMAFKRYKNRIFIPNHTGDFGVDCDIKIDPYLLGVLLGDGSFAGTSVRLSTSSDHVKQKIEGSLLGCSLNPINKNENIDYRIASKAGTNNKLLDEIRVLGLDGALSHQKFIPRNYLAASKESRLELIRGLIDTDGTVEKTGAMTYSTSSKQLAEDFQELARSLGAYASMSSRIPSYTYLGEKKQGKRSYNIYISCAHYSEFVTLPKKKARTLKKQRGHNLNISSIEYIGDFECQCIAVDHPRSLYISDGYTVTHNTAFSLALAENIARSDGDVLYFSVESTKESLTNRMISSSSGVDSSKIKTAQLADEDWSALTAGISLLKDLPVHFIDIPSIDISHASAIARKFNRKKKVKAIFIDYIQLMTAKGCKSEYETVSAVSRGLKALAKDCDAPVIALAQLSREVDKRPNKRPNLSDLRATGQLEQDGDIIGFLYRDEYYNKDSDFAGITELGIQKNRDGSTDDIFFSSDLSKMKYKELGYKPQTQQQDSGYKPFRN